LIFIAAVAPLRGVGGLLRNPRHNNMYHSFLSVIADEMKRSGPGIEAAEENHFHSEYVASENKIALSKRSS
jgi:hypothetical protein